MRGTLPTFALIGVLLSRSVSASWRHQPPFPCPSNIANDCTPYEQTGFDWQDLQEGNFKDYKGYKFDGWKCGRRPGKGGKRSFGDKCIESDIDRDTFTNTINAPSKPFSIGEMEISIGGVSKVDLEIHYVMEDGSVCRKFAPCTEDGDIIPNDQCGGAKQVKIKIPQQSKNHKCQIFIHKIKFVCGNTVTTVPVPTTTIPVETSTTDVPPFTTPAPCNPGDNSEECPVSTPASSTGTPASADCNPANPNYNPAACAAPSTTEAPPPVETTPGTTEIPGSTTEVPPPVQTTPPTECDPAENPESCPPTTTAPPPGTTEVPPPSDTTPPAETTPVSQTRPPSGITTPPSDSVDCAPGSPNYNSAACATATSTEVPPPSDTIPPVETTPVSQTSPPVGVTTTPPDSVNCNPSGPNYNSAACATASSTDVPPPSETTPAGTVPPPDSVNCNPDSPSYDSAACATSTGGIPPVTTPSVTTEVSPTGTTQQPECNLSNPSERCPPTKTISQPPAATTPGECNPANGNYDPVACASRPPTTPPAVGHTTTPAVPPPPPKTTSLGGSSTQIYPPPSKSTTDSAISAPETTSQTGCDPSNPSANCQLTSVSPKETSIPENPPASVTTPVAPPAPPPPTDCPDLVPKCLKTWIFITNCIDTADTKCICANKKFFEEVVDCINSWGSNNGEIKKGMEYLFGLCATFVEKNPEVVTCIPSSITFGPTSTPMPQTPLPPAASGTDAPSYQSPPPPQADQTQTYITATVTKTVGCAPTTISGTLVTETKTVVPTTITVPRVTLVVTQTEAQLIYPPPVTSYITATATQTAFVTRVETLPPVVVTTSEANKGYTTVTMPAVVITTVLAPPTGGDYVPTTLVTKTVRPVPTTSGKNGTVPIESEGGAERTLEGKFGFWKISAALVAIGVMMMM